MEVFSTFFQCQGQFIDYTCSRLMAHCATATLELRFWQYGTLYGQSQKVTQGTGKPFLSCLGAAGVAVAKWLLLHPVAAR